MKEQHFIKCNMKFRLCKMRVAKQLADMYTLSEVISIYLVGR